ncbi:MAG: hypothetical protein HKP39_13230 [Eudoraea sp.]|nr:hypothetical protein [Eudoraea sp.]
MTVIDYVGLLSTKPGHFDMSCNATIEKSRLHLGVIENSQIEISHTHFVRFEMTDVGRI